MTTSAAKSFTVHTSGDFDVVSGTILYDDAEVDDEIDEIEFLGPPPVRRAIRLVPSPRGASLRERLKRLAPDGMVLMPRRRRPIAVP